MNGNKFAWAAVQARNSLPHGKRPTDTHIRIAWVLARWQNPSPPHAKLARAAKCGRNTVGNALRRFRALGLLTWERQVVTLRGGWRAKIANRYVLLSNSCFLKKEKEPIFSCPTKFGHPAKSAGLRQPAQRAAVREDPLEAALAKLAVTMGLA